MSELSRMLLKRPLVGIHPKILDQEIPDMAFKTDDRNSPNSYDHLTDESLFSDYAWAFLRRNRFYQFKMDNKPQGYSVDLWGYKSHADIPANCGLITNKPYDEPHDKGVAIEWEGIHSFYERHWSPNSQHPSSRAKLDFPAIQFHVVFDMDDVLGPSANAIDIQLNVARAMLLKRAAAMGLNPTMPAQKPDKNMKARLRSMLRVADLLSPEKKKSGDDELVWDINKEKPLLQAVAEKLLPCDFGKCVSDKQKVKKASDLAKEAFEAIYQWELLNWLRFDPWHEILLKEKTGADANERNDKADIESDN